MRIYFAIPVLCMFVGASWVLGAEEPLPAKVKFNRDIRPILTANCVACHGPDEKHRKGKLRLDTQAGLLGKRKDGAAVVAGAPDKSLVYERIMTTDLEDVMPPPKSKKELSPREKALIKRWIEQGAEHEGHWSFIKPKKGKVPAVKNRGWVKNAIDAYILARLEQEGLTPNGEADRATLIRRVTFDLTGLPPTPKEVDTFVSDKSPQAYENLVDRLLASKHFGERMALMWMDAARYGDSSVFHADGPRDMWAWRDWVINAYNKNMGFDQFTIEQLAGDLIKNATVSQKVASAFNRNHGTTDEGGVIAEEARVEYVVDRVKTTSTVWLGMTMECAQCHDHKYDPMTQKEYYQFYAFFNQTSDPGMQTRRGNQAPIVSVPRMGADKELKRLEGELKRIEAEEKKYVASKEGAFKAWAARMSKTATGKTTVPGDMLAYYPLNEGKGKYVVDSVNKKRRGTIKGGRPLWGKGKQGGALRLNGRVYADLGQVGDFDTKKGFSYGAWVYLDGNGAPIAKMTDGNAHRGYDLYVAGNKVSVHLIHRWPQDAIKVTTKKAFKRKRWYHMFVTYDGSSKAAGVKIYVNGKSEPWAIEQNGLKGSIKSKSGLYIGRRNPGSPFRGMVDDVRLYDRTLSAAEVGALAGADPIKPILAIAAEKRNAGQWKVLKDHYFASVDKGFGKFGRERSKINGEMGTWRKPLTTVMVMQEQPKPRMTYILNRGEYSSPIKDEVIKPGTPASLGKLKAGLPQNRLGLAKWLVDKDHPLTSRVTVNRYWMMFFGNGIVKSVEDFGSQGEWPSHPELLDYLAVDFVESGWDIKRMIRQLVTSATYRQSSRVKSNVLEADPENRLYARGPRFRLQGEFIRDQALALSGLLVKKIGGPSTKPYQPPGLWNEVSLSGNVRFRQDKGEGLYRRSMYIYWKRSAPHPGMRIFDAPTREKCVIRRPRTNTPLQALVTLNDPQFVEASRLMARRVIIEGGKTPAERIAYGYKLATAKAPSKKVLGILLAIYHEEESVYRAAPDKAKAFLSVGDKKRDESIPPHEHAAYTIVMNLILNLDETLTKG